MIRYSREQEHKLNTIRVYNVINDISLKDVAVEEMGELIIEFSQGTQGGLDKEHILEELIGTMNTCYNYLMHYYKYDEIEKCINKQLNKCLTKLGIEEK